MASKTSAFITAVKLQEVKKEIEDLEGLLGGNSSQSTLLLKKKKEMREVDESLHLMKQDYKKRMEDCESRRQQFLQNQTKQREQVLKFEKFIQENDAKRQRAEQKCKAERKQFEEECKEISNLEAQRNDMLVMQKNLHDERVSKNCYKEYFERIVEDGEYGYEEIQDILARYKTLKSSNNDLMLRSEEQDNEINERKKSLQALKTETQNQILVSNSIFQSLQKELEVIRSKVKAELEEEDRFEEKRQETTKELGQVVQSIKNVFVRCQSSMRNKSVFPTKKETLGLAEILKFELDNVCYRMSDLVEICAEYKEELESGAIRVIEAGPATNDPLAYSAHPGSNNYRAALTSPSTGAWANPNTESRISPNHSRGSKTVLK